MDRTAGGVLIAFLLPWSTLRLTPSSPPVLVLISRSIVWKDTRRKPAPLLYADIFLSIIYHHLSRIYIYLLVDIVSLHLHGLRTYLQTLSWGETLFIPNHSHHNTNHLPSSLKYTTWLSRCLNILLSYLSSSD